MWPADGSLLPVGTVVTEGSVAERLWRLEFRGEGLLSPPERRHLMPRFVLKKPFFSLGGEDLSADVSQVMLTKGHTAVTQSPSLPATTGLRTPRPGRACGRWRSRFEVDGYDAAERDGPSALVLSGTNWFGMLSLPVSLSLCGPDSGHGFNLLIRRRRATLCLQSIEPLGSGQVGSSGHVHAQPGR